MRDGSLELTKFSALGQLAQRILRPFARSCTKRTITLSKEKDSNTVYGTTGADIVRILSISLMNTCLSGDTPLDDVQCLYRMQTLALALALERIVLDSGRVV